MRSVRRLPAQTARTPQQPSYSEHAGNCLRRAMALLIEQHLRRGGTAAVGEQMRNGASEEPPPVPRAGGGGYVQTDPLVEADRERFRAGFLRASQFANPGEWRPEKLRTGQQSRNDQNGEDGFSDDH